MLDTELFDPMRYSKTCLKRLLKKNRKMIFNTDYSLIQIKRIAECSKRNESFCNTSTFIRQPFFIKTFNSSIFKWPLTTGFTVLHSLDKSYFQTTPVLPSALVCDQGSVLVFVLLCITLCPF